MDKIQNKHIRGTDGLETKIERQREGLDMCRVRIKDRLFAIRIAV